MKFPMVTALLVTIAAAGIVVAHEGHKHAKPGAAPAVSKPAATAPAVNKVQLAGEIIDPQCWFTHNAQGVDHADCAVNCAKGGQDLAFLDERTGDLYTLIAVSHGKNPNIGLYDHVGVPVRVKGTAYRRGNNRGLIVEAVEKQSRSR